VTTAPSKPYASARGGIERAPDSSPAAAATAGARRWRKNTITPTTTAAVNRIFSSMKSITQGTRGDEETMH